MQCYSYVEYIIERDLILIDVLSSISSFSSFIYFLGSCYISMIYYSHEQKRKTQEITFALVNMTCKITVMLFTAVYIFLRLLRTWVLLFFFLWICKTWKGYVCIQYLEPSTFTESTNSFLFFSLFFSLYKFIYEITYIMKTFLDTIFTLWKIRIYNNVVP